MGLPWRALVVPPSVWPHVHRCCCASAKTHSDDRIENLFEQCYYDLDGYCETAEEAKSINARFGERASTYGEVSVQGARRILARLFSSQSRDNTIFLDLGSGIGKIVALAALEHGSVVRSIGVELCESRHARAIVARDRLLAACSGSCSTNLAQESVDRVRCERIEFRLGDMLEAHQAVAQCTHVFLSSLLFNEETMRSLALLLDGAPHLTTIATLQEFPSDVKWSFVADGTVLARMDWHTGEVDPGIDVFIYSRQST